MKGGMARGGRGDPQFWIQRQTCQRGCQVWRERAPARLVRVLNYRPLCLGFWSLLLS